MSFGKLRGRRRRKSSIYTSVKESGQVLEKGQSILRPYCSDVENLAISMP